MTPKKLRMARIYLMENSHQAEPIIAFLRDRQKIAGLTVLRGIEGFGGDRELHTSSLLSLSLELPLIIEFYDEAGKVQSAVRDMKTRFALPHIVSWPITGHFD